MKLIRSKSRAFSRRIFHILLKRMAKAPAPVHWRWLLGLFGWTALEPRLLADAAVEKHCLYNVSSSTVSPPTFVGSSQISSSSVFPGPLAYTIANAAVGAYASAVVSGGRLLLPEHILKSRDRAVIDGDGHYILEREYCIARIENLPEIASGIMVGGSGAFNYYHYIFECLPSAFLAISLPGEYADVPLLVPEECRYVDSFSEALACFAHGRPIQYLTRGKFVSVKKLIVIEPISYSPFNLREGLWPRTSDYFQHDDLLRRYISKLRAAILGLNQHTKLPARRIFLIRPQVRRKYNQDALVEIAQKHGFDTHSPEHLTLREQALLFANAEMIIGPSGAAWVGMAFCRSPTRMLSWLPGEYRQFCSYSNLALLLGHRMQFIETCYRQPLSSTGDAYMKSYMVDPEKFELALLQMVGAHAIDPVP